MILNREADRNLSLQALGGRILSTELVSKNGCRFLSIIQITQGHETNVQSVLVISGVIFHKVTFIVLLGELCTHARTQIIILTSSAAHPGKFYSLYFVKGKQGSEVSSGLPEVTPLNGHPSWDSNPMQLAREPDLALPRPHHLCVRPDLGRQSLCLTLAGNLYVG